MSAASAGGGWNGRALLVVPVVLLGAAGAAAALWKGGSTSRPVEQQESSPKDARKAKEEAESEQPRSKTQISIFWDVDNCAPPSAMSGLVMAEAIRNAVASVTQGSSASIVSFRAYLELSTEGAPTSASQVQLRSQLQGSGVSLIDTPKSGRKDVADHMVMVDMMAFAIDHPPPALIVLLSGDRDFAYAVSTLRNRGFTILLITPPVGASPILTQSAHQILRWRQDVLGLWHDGNGRLYDQPAAAPTPRKPLVAEKSASATPIKKSGSKSGAIPAIFQPLANVLEEFARDGVLQPLRSKVAPRLLQHDKAVYARADVRRWQEYVAVAEARGIILLGDGGTLGSEWISLANVKSKAPKEKEAAPAPPTARPATPARPAPAAASKAKAKSKLAKGSDTFQPLIDVLSHFYAQGFPKVARATAASRLLQYDSDAFRRAGTADWSGYASLAEGAGVVILGVDPEANGFEFVALSEEPANAQVLPQLEPTFAGLPAKLFAPLVKACKEHKTVDGVAAALDESVYKAAGVADFPSYLKLATDLEAVVKVTENGWIKYSPKLAYLAYMED